MLSFPLSSSVEVTSLQSYPSRCGGKDGGVKGVVVRGSDAVWIDLSTEFRITINEGWSLESVGVFVCDSDRSFGGDVDCDSLVESGLL